jgi:hypothetical protein
MNGVAVTATAPERDNDIACTTLRRCKHCSQLRPITEFRRMRTGQERRHTVCRECRKRLRREETRLQREKIAHRYAQRVNRLAAEEKYNAIMAVTTEMIARFQGLDGFVQCWKAAVDAAAKKGKDHLVCRSLLAVANLATTCSVLQATANPSGQVDDEDLRRQFEEIAVRVIAQHPELALRAALKLGWELRPGKAHTKEAERI